ncbi:hypothetical protein [Christiangramia forsetii]|uniref:PKD domain-containing protein n=3 Tax=Christiangramia forsetii TaxID=411153 RepID=A0M709_CHRFK|nr:hypothetical protein [Christiangramia forsetii]GGG29013.1 hypothetical protein GCM10011532_10600 [Christiangramia forsetii]CAL68404.1 conserved hypothetical protein [Christiangramia forsetii KT0803]
MKHIKQLLVLFLAFNVFTSCEKEEETSYILQDVSAPTGISAAFDISNDEEGTVSVTPTAEGATEFQVYFGDTEGEDPLIVAPGETVNHTYAEGEYNLRIVAVGLTGLTSELVRVVTISFGAPSELEVDIEKSTTNPLEIIVTPTAVGATVYDIYFGDIEDEEPTTIMDGESANHIYAEEGDYTVRVVARGGGAATVEYSEEVSVSAASGASKLPITFDDATVNYAFETFNGANFEILDNPQLSGINSEESMVGAITNSGNAFEGVTFQLGEPVDFSGDNKTITLKFYSEVAVPLLLKFEGGVNDERQNEVNANHTGSGWEEISFDFATNAKTSYISDSDPGGEAFVPEGQYATMTLFVDGPGTTAGTFYLDDVMQAGGEPGEAFKLPVTFDSETVAYTNSGVSFEIVTNPNQSGINSTDTKVGAVTNAGANFEAITFTLDEAVDFSGDNKTITMKVYSEVAYPVLFKFETGVNGERANEVEVNHGGTGWEELTFDFANNARNSFVQGDDANNGQPFVPTGQYDQFSIFLDFAGATAGTFYIDDVFQATGGDGSNGGGATGITTTSFPVDFESAMNGGAAANWSIFENADNPALEIISNPDASGVNTSATVAKFIARQGGQSFAGTITQLQNSLTLDESNSIVKIMVWKSVVSDVGIKFENPEGGSTGEIKVANTKTNEWEELTFDFSGVIGRPENSNITGLVIFPDFQERMQDNVVFFDNITLNAAGSTGGNGGGETSEDFALPINFGADIEYTTGANSVPFEVVTNPEQSGINATDTKVGKVTNQGGQYEALTFLLDEAIDFSGSNKTITMKVYSEVAYQVLFKLETGMNGERANEVEVSHSGNGWEELSFNFNNARNSFVQGDDANNGQPFVPTGQYDEISIFLDFAGFTAGDFYIDDIEQN